MGCKLRTFVVGAFGKANLRDFSCLSDQPSIHHFLVIGGGGESEQNHMYLGQSPFFALPLCGAHCIGTEKVPLAFLL